MTNMIIPIFNNVFKPFNTAYIIRTTISILTTFIIIKSIIFYTSHNIIFHLLFANLLFFKFNLKFVLLNFSKTFNLHISANNVDCRCQIFFFINIYFFID